MSYASYDDERRELGYGPMGGGGANWKMRLILAAMIALVSIISFYSMTTENPITGEHQRVGMSEDQEIAMGLQAAPQMEQEHGGLSPNPAARATVDRVGERILAALNKSLREQHRENPYPFKFHLLNDPKTVNAFALPGGQVFITTGLYKLLETEGQLAGVLGHEIGHVLSRHGAQQLAKQQLTQGLAGAAGMAGGDRNAAQIAAQVGALVNMKYGRGAETEADKWGVKLAAEAGYDPRAMIGVMQILDKASGDGGPPEFLSTHPKPANRIQYIKTVIQKEFPNGVPAGLEP
ncbi:MAG TPA: M48 family metallopeptidase [Pirellulales bacterium]|nr:M48 family metallopeptidase [Pirellulales bacterium]